MRDFDRTVISQYSNSATLCQLIENLNTYIDPAADLQRFYDLIWNVDTAVGYGLDVWGRIVGVDRVVKVPSTKYFGFAEAGSFDSDPFDQAPFYNGDLLTEAISLNDEDFRRLIFAKAAANITDCSIPALNQMLLNLFPGRGNAYVADDHPPPDGRWFTFEESALPDGPIYLTGGGNHLTDGSGNRLTITNSGLLVDSAWGFNQQPFGDFAPARPPNMRMTYVFAFTLTDVELAIVGRSGVLPRPTGVRADVSYRF